MGISRRWAGVFFAALGVCSSSRGRSGFSIRCRRGRSPTTGISRGRASTSSSRRALLGTAFALLDGRAVGRSFAAATGALLLADAWFDVVTAGGGRDRWAAVVLAVCAEIPLAILCFALARPGPGG